MTTPERRAYQKRLYDLEAGEHLGGHIDNWHYERDLPTAMAALCDEAVPLGAAEWIDTLVPFVSGLWVRSPDRNDGVNNEGRVIEFQEVLAPVAAANWTVAHFPSDSLILCDRGFTVLICAGQPALVVPVDSATALILTSGSVANLLRDDVGRWMAPVEHELNPDLDPVMVNQAVAAAAIQDVYGPSRELVEAARSARVVDPHVNGLPFLAEPTDLRAHFFDYFRLRAAVRVAPGAEQLAADRADWADLDLEPNCPIAVEVLRPERTRGAVVAVGRDRLVLTLEWGQSIKQLRTAAGEAINGASIVMSAAQLSGGPKPVVLGLEWSSRGSNLSQVPMINIETGAQATVDLARLRDDILERVRQLPERDRPRRASM